MFLLFLSVILIAPILGVWLYKHHGKRQIFNFDIVQFVYLFVLCPIILLWGKSFLFYLIRNELDYALNLNQIFFIDTVFTLLSFYIFSAVTVHSLTKSFWVRKNQDPDFDIFHLSEYFHLWWSHLVMFVGAFFLLTFVSVVNLWLPFSGEPSMVFLPVSIIFGSLLGVVGFLIIWNSDPKLEKRNFMRLMKLIIGLFFTIHVYFYFIFEPIFKVEYSAYWFSFCVLLSMVFCGLIMQRSKWFKKLLERLQHPGWGQNLYTKF